MRILVIRPGALGDTLLTLPTLDALQNGFPEAEIEAMGNLEALQLLLGRSHVSGVSAFDRLDMALLFQPDVSLPASLQGCLDAFDLILSYAAPPGHVFAANLERAARGRVLSFDPRPLSGSRMHMSEHLQLPLRELGIAPSHEPPQLRLTLADQEAAGQWWSAHGLTSQRAVAIHPGSGSATKNWLAARFAEVSRWLVQQRQLYIVLIEGPADESTVAQWRSYFGGDQYVLAPSLPLPLVAGVLARCTLFVGNDSGVSHLAAAVGTPAVVVFGPTDPEVWAPRGKCVRIVHGSGACAACSADMDRTSLDEAGLYVASVTDVLQQVDKLCPNG